MIQIARRDGPFNMSEDAWLLSLAEEGRAGWRVYGWDGPWVSLGGYQSASKDLLNPELVPWVMRPTGGKAVLHGHDVTVGLSLPLSLLSEVSRIEVEKLARSLRTVYRFAIAPVVEALRECGQPAVLGEIFWTNDKRQTKNDNGMRLSDCFAVTSPNDIVHEQTGMKVCGCALKLTQKAVLVQASIPAGPPLVDPHRVFAHPSLIPLSPWRHEEFPKAFDEVMRQLLAKGTVSL